jgi:hypothetical protein
MVSPCFVPVTRSALLIVEWMNGVQDVWLYTALVNLLVKNYVFWDLLQVIVALLDHRITMLCASYSLRIWFKYVESVGSSCFILSPGVLERHLLFSIEQLRVVNDASQYWWVFYQRQGKRDCRPRRHSVNCFTSCQFVSIRLECFNCVTVS